MPSSTSSSEGRPGRWPLGLLLGAALFAGSERLLWSHSGLLPFAARYTPRGPDGDALVTEAALRSLPREPPPILLLGSSQVREGLDCAAFELAAAGRPCRNLAISAGSPLDALFVTRRLDAAAPRRTVILGLFPKVMHLAPKEGFVDVSTWSCLLAGSPSRLVARDWIAATFGLLQRLSPTLRFKDALWSLHGVVRTDPRAAWSWRLPPQPERLMAAEAPRPARYFEARLGLPDSDFPPPGRFTPANEVALERIVEGERARGNPAIVVDFPTRPGYETTLPPEALSHYAGLTARLRARLDRTFVGSGELGPLGTDDFLDFTHLSAGGREKVSQRLAARLAPWLVSSR